MDKDGYHGYYRDEPFKQRPWVGLTDEEIGDCFEIIIEQDTQAIKFARTIESKLKEKNSYE